VGLDPIEMDFEPPSAELYDPEPEPSRRLEPSRRIAPERSSSRIFDVEALDRLAA
jgi:hypothetical protein